MKKIAVTLLIFFCDFAQAGQLEDLAREAHRLYSPDIPFSMPKIEYIDTEWLTKKICAKSCPKNWEVKGFYYDGTVYLKEDLLFNTDQNRSYVVHEMVHYYQEVTGAFVSTQEQTCVQRRILETQAYEVQDQYLRSKGKRISDKNFIELVNASSINCAKQQSIPLADQQHNSQQTP